MWLKQTLGVQGWSGFKPHQRICWLCRATRGDCLDASRGAPWRGTDVTMDDVCSGGRDGGFISSIWMIPGLAITSIKPDWMHVVDLGILQTFLGSVLYELFRALGGTWSSHMDACGKLMGLIRLQARALNMEVPISQLTIFMIRVSNKKKPHLRAKAAESRYLCPIVLEILKHCFPSSSPYATLRIQCLEALNDCYRTFDDWQGAESTRRLGELGRRHIVLLMELQNTCGLAKLYLVQPKHHLFVHLCERAWANPRIEWCYGDESEIEVAIRICS